MTEKNTEETVAEAKKFDLMAAIEGRGYPEIQVPIFLDEELMYQYAKISFASDQDPANKDLEKARDEMLESFKEQALIVTVRGVPRHVLRSVALSLNADFKLKKDRFGEVEDNSEADEAYGQRMWEAFVVLVETPDGEKIVPAPEVITALRNKAPQVTIDAIETAINEVRGGAKSGYEQAVAELPFLSQPSAKG